ncbi:helix-turn-helix domain-containing protein [Clostridium psychrophilum]|uniref:helix-turn-helix domain-containing protein n=1 Tax=Clostridium psychrophilum TaxID=132926 RepID=UPI001C0BEFF9|nr:AraC family transcriptional regulator [Clostridium psychrophilum]MBU3182997.1 AraC family transcriptional regulator [Clostridium psychrophilum]
MQNQPKNKYIFEYAPINLPQDFPVAILDLHKLSEKVTGLHTHNCLEIGYCYEGSGIFIINNKVLSFSKGDISIIFNNQFHKAQSEKCKASVWHFIYLDPEKLLSEISIKELTMISNIVKGSADFINILSSDKYQDLVYIVKLIISELTFCSNSYHSVIKGLTWAFLKSIGRLIKVEDTTSVHSQHFDILKVIPAINYISKNYMNKIQIDYLASLCNTSLTSFRRHFRTALKVSPLEYMVTLRIQTASSLLENTDYSVLDIALKVGYNSLSSFNRHFKRLKGVAPLEWRAAHHTISIVF